MELFSLTGKNLKDMIARGKKHLEDNAEYVDSLNVFPVPDGDTGTNMSLTFTSGAKAVKDTDAEAVGEVGKVLSKGLLMGARGNSGVILSQLFRGFGKAIENKELINSQEFAQAFQNGVESAYQAIMKPVEGTILTVARESAESGLKKATQTDDIIEVMEEILKISKQSLENTPNLLAVLKEVGVVDSGGQGLVYIYEGFMSALTGEEIIEDEELDLSELVRAEHHRLSAHDVVDTDDIEYGFCTEIMVRLEEEADKDFDYDGFRDYLSELGDSLLVIADEDVVKVHVHTEQPGEVMNYGQNFGTLIHIKVDNMREQHAALETKTDKSIPEEKTKELKNTAIIAVGSGAGIKKLYESLGVDYLIEGGQTMNPSTQDFLDAMTQVPAKRYILLPNNSNIFMAANQAAEVADAETIVVETRTIQQGMGAMLSYSPDASLEDNQEMMTEELDYIKSGQITFAIRDTEINGLTIKKDDFMGLIDGEIVVATKDIRKTALETIDQMLDEESEIITLLSGIDVEEELISDLEETLEKDHPEIEIEIHEGGQPVYPLLISVE